MNTLADLIGDEHTNVGAEQGMKLSSYVLENFLVPVRDRHAGEGDED